MLFGYCFVLFICLASHEKHFVLQVLMCQGRKLDANDFVKLTYAMMCCSEKSEGSHRQCEEKRIFYKQTVMYV